MHLKDKKVIVFGGSGFLGSYVVDALIEHGANVTIFDCTRPLYGSAFSWINGDILNLHQVVDAVDGVDYVYNFAGLADLNASIDQPLKTVNLNILGNTHILEGCRLHGVRRFVYASSAYVFSAKGAFYGVSKKASELLIEQYAKQYDLRYTIIRYGSVYGERADQQNRIYRILKQALEEGVITFQGDGSEVREYIHARDCARLSIQILDTQYENKNIILTGTEKYKYADLLDLINEILGGTLKIDCQNKDYEGHYTYSPYSFSPSVGQKLITNPCVDFGQGLLECIDKIHFDICEEKDSTAVSR